MRFLMATIVRYSAKQGRQNSVVVKLDTKKKKKKMVDIHSDSVRQAKGSLFLLPQFRIECHEDYSRSIQLTTSLINIRTERCGDYALGRRAVGLEWTKS